MPITYYLSPDQDIYVMCQTQTDVMLILQLANEHNFNFQRVIMDDFDNPFEKELYMICQAIQVTIDEEHPGAIYPDNQKIESVLKSIGAIRERSNPFHLTNLQSVGALSLFSLTTEQNSYTTEQNSYKDPMFNVEQCDPASTI